LGDAAARYHLIALIIIHVGDVSNHLLLASSRVQTKFLSLRRAGRRRRCPIERDKQGVGDGWIRPSAGGSAVQRVTIGLTPAP